jgi:hypothetical protein
MIKPLIGSGILGPLVTLGSLVALSALTSCGGIVEPGVPPSEPTPLFDGYMSYRTLDEIQRQLPNRSNWQIVSDSKIPARGPCPRFDELMFEIPANHLGHKGKLRLTFINERLRSTAFIPEDFPSYVEALRASGVDFDAEGRSSKGPATRIWQWHLGEPFVGWTDARFSAQTNAWVSYCS